MSPAIMKFVEDYFARATAGVPAPLLAMALMVVSTLGFAGMHAIIRYTSRDMHPFEIAFFRNLFGLAVLVPFIYRAGLGALRTSKPHLHLIRGSIQMVAMLMFFTGVSLAPLAKVSAVSFTAPLWATLGAILFLGERVRARRITALAVGFLGAMVIIRPGVAVLDLGAMLVLGSSAIWAVAMLIIKVLARTESSITITLYMGLVMTPISFVVAVFFWQWPSWEQLALFALMGALGSGAHVCLAHAFKIADTSVVLPLDFTRLIWASLLGYFLFAEVPAFWTWLGGAMIFLATTYIAYREARLKEPAAD